MSYPAGVIPVFLVFGLLSLISDIVKNFFKKVLLSISQRCMINKHEKIRADTIAL
jgi:hypothetical protein